MNCYYLKLVLQTIIFSGLGVPDSKVWERLLALAEGNEQTDLEICPTMYGERHNPGQRATVSNITPLNTTLGSVFCALCKGLVQNLHGMMPREVLDEAGVQRILGSGIAYGAAIPIFSHNPIINRGCFFSENFGI
mgnify:CR=1 FL=1